MHSYNWTLEKIREKLREREKNQGNKLKENDINEEVVKFKKILEVLKDSDESLCEHFFSPFKYEDYKDLTHKQWSSLGKTLESDFDIEWVPGGHIIVGPDQKDRNTTWWTDEVKPGKDFYWLQYKEYILLKEFNLNIVNTIEADVDRILNNIGNPKDDKFERYGMVVGHVQSGKTGNYASLICKAADAGYKFIVIFSGTNINNLRNQTQARINNTFVGKNDNGICGVSNGRKRHLGDIPLRLTTDFKDFDKRTAQTAMAGVNFETISVPIILVVKKNATILRNLSNWLTEQYRDVIVDHSMLIIDDESDYASVNTKKDEEDPATINGLIRNLLGLFNKSAYVAYTATPFANIYIDYESEEPVLGKDLFPRDFIFPINAPDNYIGASKIFGNKGNFLANIDDHQDTIPLKHKKDYELTGLPESLYDAIRVFLLNVAIRNLRGHNLDNHNSMLVHVTLYTMIHMRVHNLIEEYLNEIKSTVVSFAKLPNYSSQSKHFKELEETFKVRHLEVNINFEYSWHEVLDSLFECIETVKIRQVHSNKKVPQLDYKDSDPVNVIVVGGLSLSRGFTLEGLSVSYFIRGTKLYDTLMQMARWFGYRDGYEDLCRVYLTLDLQDHFKHIQKVITDLFESFEIMANEGKTPYDFGLYVIEHPDNVLQVTAKNKMRSTSQMFTKMNLNGHLKEMGWLHDNKNERNLTNILAIKEILSQIDNEYKSTKIGTQEQKSYLWRNVEKRYIKTFMNSFNVFGATEFNFNSKMPLAFMKEFVRTYDGYWDVCLFGGKGQGYEPIKGLKIQSEQRKIISKESFREIPQLSAVNSEAINLPEVDRKKFSKDRKGARAYENRNHLLMLHFLDDYKHNGEIIAAYGISFSGNGTEGRSTKIRMNKVMIDEINKLKNRELEELQDEE